MMLVILLVLAAFQLGAGALEECQAPPTTGLVFKRLFITKYSGPVAVKANREMVNKIIGQCRSTEEHANNMIRYFQSYGFDVDMLKQDPYAEFENENFKIFPDIVNSQANYSIIASSSDRYAKVENIPLAFASWNFAVKKDFRGPKGLIKGKTSLIYGEYVFKVDGKYMCIRYQDPPRTTFTDFTTMTGLIAARIQLWNEHLGAGSMRGIFRNTNGFLEGNTVISFPAEVN